MRRAPWSLAWRFLADLGCDLSTGPSGCVCRLSLISFVFTFLGFVVIVAIKIQLFQH